MIRIQVSSLSPALLSFPSLLQLTTFLLALIDYFARKGEEKLLFVHKKIYQIDTNENRERLRGSIVAIKLGESKTSGRYGIAETHGSDGLLADESWREYKEQIVSDP